MFAYSDFLSRLFIWSCTTHLVPLYERTKRLLSLLWGEGEAAYRSGDGGGSGGVEELPAYLVSVRERRCCLSFRQSSSGNPLQHTSGFPPKACGNDRLGQAELGGPVCLRKIGKTAACYLALPWGTVVTPRRFNVSLAAICSACFLLRPMPWPSLSPAIATSTMKVLR